MPYVGPRFAPRSTMYHPQNNQAGFNQLRSQIHNIQMRMQGGMVRPQDGKTGPQNNSGPPKGPVSSNTKLNQPPKPQALESSNASNADQNSISERPNQPNNANTITNTPVVPTTNINMKNDNQGLDNSPNTKPSPNSGYKSPKQEIKPPVSATGPPKPPPLMSHQQGAPSRNTNVSGRPNDYGSSQQMNSNGNFQGQNFGNSNDYNSTRNSFDNFSRARGNIKQEYGNRNMYDDGKNYPYDSQKGLNLPGAKTVKPYYGVDKIKEKVKQTFVGPQVDLPTLDMSEKKFNSYSRLFIGNLPKNVTQEEMQAAFSKFGEIGGLYVNKDSSYAFVNFDYRANALKAMREMDNTQIKGRMIKVRFAAISEGVRVKNLSISVSNELLEKAFSVFGMVEACKIIVDDRGMTKGEGIIIFKEKKTAVLAVKKCQEECYILSGTARPVIVTPLEPAEDNEEGLPEANLSKNEDYQLERRVGPHFAEEGSFEFDFGLEWKKVYQMNEDRKKNLEREFLFDIERLEKKMVLARVEFEKEKLRKELAAREAESVHLRRHFEAEMSNQNIPYPERSENRPYDSYSAQKRAMDPAYENTYAVPYEGQYKEPYDRSYGREYERPYSHDYERGFGGYGRDTRYEMPAERPPHEERKYDAAVADSHYDRPDMSSYGAMFERPAADEYKPPKRPRY